MIDVSRVMRGKLAQDAFNIVRGPAGSFSNEGQWTPGSGPEAQIPAIGIVKPNSLDATQFLPEGERVKKNVTIYTSTPLYMSDGLYDQNAVVPGSVGFGDQAYGSAGFGSAPGTPADLVDWQGERYRVVMSKPWHTRGYYYAIATFVGYTPSV